MPREIVKSVLEKILNNTKESESLLLSHRECRGSDDYQNILSKLVDIQRIIESSTYDNEVTKEMIDKLDND